eukprot:TRINITY_DN10541_c0_g1_i1.p1 TRINITY_DN10541_c0_g1~~TRINITY_DN10541_c0_g1_i1.p1  ORF type:complete len:487 (-),score=114.38 TRINITY_DN10541_c0_g1_i1:20-1480(-)
MKREIVVSCLFVFVAFSTAADNFDIHQNQLLQNGWSQSRSGDFEAFSTEYFLNNAKIVTSIDHLLDNEIEDVQLYNLLARSFSLPPNDEYDVNIPYNIFNAPKANLLFIVDGATSDNGIKFANSHIPFDHKSIISSSLTGNTPSVHGVVAGTDKSSMLPGIYDVITGLYPESIILSGSSTRNNLLSMLPVHQSDNVFSCLLDSETGKIISEDPFSGKLDDLAHALHSFVSDVVIEQNGEELIVSSVANGIQSVAFPLEHEESKFFKELHFIQYIMNIVSHDNSFQALTLDNHPDFFTFSLTSLKELTEKYGSDTTITRTANILVQKAIDSTKKNLEVLYGVDNIAYQTIYMNTPQQVTEEIKDILAESTRVSLDSSLPQIYLKGESQILEVCEKVKQNTKDLIVYCPENVRRSLHEELLTRAIYEDEDTPTHEDVVIFQISMWTGVVLVISLVYAVYTLYYMDIDTDDMIYRQTAIYTKYPDIQVR